MGQEQENERGIKGIPCPVELVEKIRISQLTLLNLHDNILEYAAWRG
jgi:hypothetical protein